MLRFCSLYSGSTGNSFLVQSSNTNILIDAGVSTKKIVDALNNLDIDVKELEKIMHGQFGTMTQMRSSSSCLQ